jgi:hypothetical protein
MRAGLRWTGRQSRGLHLPQQYDRQPYNNVFVQSDGRELVRLDNSGAAFEKDVQLLRNAYWPTGSAFKIVWNGTTYNTLLAWANATGQEKLAGTLMGLQSDPQLEGPITGGVTLDDASLLASLREYRLLATSTLIDAGVDLSTLPLPVALGLVDPGDHDFFGGVIPVGATDIGAYERPIDGDFNADGNVDAADYVVWRKNDGTPTGFNLWRANFGHAAGSGQSVAGSTVPAVPEPESLALVAIAAGRLILLRVAGRSRSV